MIEVYASSTRAIHVNNYRSEWFILKLCFEKSFVVDLDALENGNCENNFVNILCPEYKCFLKLIRDVREPRILFSSFES